MRGRVALVGGGHVQVQRGAHTRQLGAELAHDFDGALARARGSGLFGPAHVLEFKTDLVQKRVERRADRVADVEILDLLAQIDRAQAHREQGAAEVLDDLTQAFLGREFA
ncbi:hypothetical protein D9M68_771890 [compost metagenome]